jgi:large subunit ribosomal protein L19
LIDGLGLKECVEQIRRHNGVLKLSYWQIGCFYIDYIQNYDIWCDERLLIMKAKTFTKETINEIGLNKVNYPAFKSGDTIVVAQRIKEGDKERIQEFQGDVIAIKKNGVSTTFTVRKIGANSIAVERIFPFYATDLIESIKVIRRGDIRRARPYYIRDRVGKATRFKEKIVTKKQLEHIEIQQSENA